eukprot:TRINITY_DN996_c0_g3_i5.p1 TRINITY_DN996_c0_g3~~TRINITY_DN996_c0_g3_i5.p1  ORF type:complete len:1704 (-),score=524.87 TRINITY_DN996_c0_g3_i5:361-5472(-)
MISLFSCNLRLQGSTTVDHALFCNFTSKNDRNLILSRGNRIEIHTVDVKNEFEDVPMLHIKSFEINAKVTSLSSAKLVGIGTDVLVITAPGQKMSIVVFDPKTMTLKTLALFDFSDELDDIALAQSTKIQQDTVPRGRESKISDTGVHISSYGQDKYGLGYASIAKVDPQNRCIVMFGGKAQFVYIPLKQSLNIDLDNMNGNGNNNNGNRGDEEDNSTTWKKYFEQPIVIDVNKQMKIKGQIKDFTLLHGLNEPTLSVLHQINPTSIGTAAETGCFGGAVTCFTLETYTSYLKSDQLPHDSLYLVPCPSPVGGVVVVSSNALFYISQNIARILATNAFAGWTISSKYENGIVDADIEDVALNWVNSKACMLESNKMLLMMSQGEVFMVELCHSPGCTVDSLKITDYQNTIASPSCLASSDIEDDHLFFVGSQHGKPALMKASPIGLHEQEDPSINFNFENLAVLENVAPVVDQAFYAREEEYEPVFSPFDKNNRINRLNALATSNLITSSGGHGSASICEFSKGLPHSCRLKVPKQDINENIVGVWTLKGNVESELLKRLEAFEAKQNESNDSSIDITEDSNNNNNNENENENDEPPSKRSKTTDVDITTPTEEEKEEEIDVKNDIIKNEMGENEEEEIEYEEDEEEEEEVEEEESDRYMFVSSESETTVYLIRPKLQMPNTDNKNLFLHKLLANDDDVDVDDETSFGIDGSVLFGKTLLVNPYGEEHFLQVQTECINLLDQSTLRVLESFYVEAEFEEDGLGAPGQTIVSASSDGNFIVLRLSNGDLRFLQQSEDGDLIVNQDEIEGLNWLEDPVTAIHVYEDEGKTELPMSWIKPPKETEDVARAANTDVADSVLQTVNPMNVVFNPTVTVPDDIDADEEDELLYGSSSTSTLATNNAQLNSLSLNTKTEIKGEKLRNGENGTESDEDMDQSNVIELHSYVTVCRESGVLQIYSLPDRQLIFENKEFAFGPSIIEHKLKPENPDEETIEEEGIRTNYAELGLEPPPVPRITDVAVCLIGHWLCLIATTSRGDTLIYNRRPFLPQIQSVGLNEIAFMKVDHGVITRPPRFLGGSAPQNGVIIPFDDMVGSQGAFICGYQPCWIFFDAGYIRVKPARVAQMESIVCMAPFHHPSLVSPSCGFVSCHTQFGENSKKTQELAVCSVSDQHIVSLDGPLTCIIHSLSDSVTLSKQALENLVKKDKEESDDDEMTETSPEDIESAFLESVRSSVIHKIAFLRQNSRKYKKSLFAWLRGVSVPHEPPPPPPVVEKDESKSTTLGDDLDNDDEKEAKVAIKAPLRDLPEPPNTETRFSVEFIELCRDGTLSLLSSYELSPQEHGLSIVETVLDQFDCEPRVRPCVVVGTGFVACDCGHSGAKGRLLSFDVHTGLGDEQELALRLLQAKDHGTCIVDLLPLSYIRRNFQQRIENYNIVVPAPTNAMALNVAIMKWGRDASTGGKGMSVQTILPFPDISIVQKLTLLKANNAHMVLCSDMVQGLRMVKLNTNTEHIDIDGICWKTQVPIRFSAMEFIFYGMVLGSLTLDNDGILRVLVQGTSGHTKTSLVPIAEYALHEQSSTILRGLVMPTAFSSAKASSCTNFMATFSGSVNVVLPVPEETFKRLFTLQQLLVQLPNPGGFDPLRFRYAASFRWNQPREFNSHVLDYTLLNRFQSLDSKLQKVIADLSGTSVEVVMDNLVEMNAQCGLI